MPRRAGLLLLLFTINLPLALVALAFLRGGVQEIRVRAGEQQLALARAGALASTSFLLDNISSLRTLSVDLDGADGQSVEALQTRLGSYIAVNPHWNGMSVVGADMRVISGAQPASRGVSLADRPYLRRLMVTGEPVVSDGLIPSVTLVPSVIVAVPLKLSDGSRGALLASVGTDELAGRLRDLVPADGGKRLSVIDHAGQVLMQPNSPSPSAPLQQVGTRPDVTAARAGHTGVGEFDQAGEQRLVAYAPVGSFGWTVTASEPVSTAFAPADRFLWNGITVTVVGGLTVATAGVILERRLRRAYDSMAESHREAENAIRSRDQFLAIASHELRTPVTAIKGHSQLIQRRLVTGRLTPENMAQNVSDLVTSSAHLARLVDDLLNVSRLQDGRFTLNEMEADLRELVAHAVGEAVSARGVAVDLDVGSERIPVMVDSDRIQQVLANLLDNAVKYSPGGTPISVRVAQGGGMARVAITDEGIGLPLEAMEQLFTPFGRASNAVEANIQGMGLGLYVSRQLAEAHGGSLTAASEGEGLGSTFTLTLPTARRSAEPSTDVGGPRVLNGLQAADAPGSVEPEPSR